MCQQAARDQMQVIWVNIAQCIAFSLSNIFFVFKWPSHFKTKKPNYAHSRVIAFCEVEIPAVVKSLVNFNLHLIILILARPILLTMEGALMTYELYKNLFNDVRIPSTHGIKCLIKNLSWRIHRSKIWCQDIWKNKSRPDKAFMRSLALRFCRA